jgi:hypothetical protein
LHAEKLLENLSDEAILKYLQKRRNSPADKWVVLRFLAKGEAGDLLDKWACGMKIRGLPPMAC